MSVGRVPGLRYVTDETPGIRRRRSGNGFTYLRPSGRRIRDRAALKRLKALAVPPAWTDVWICPDANGHILATGRDGKGRKQYRYHPRWRSVRDEAKFERLVAFAEALPGLRRRVRRDMARTGMPKERVLATVVALLDCCFARIGNEEYARSNGSFGLTTLRGRHARFDGSRVAAALPGQEREGAGGLHRRPRIVHIVRKCQTIPGQVLFQYIDQDGGGVPIGSTDVNDYLRDATGEEFTAKDFRTWAGTVAAVRELCRAGSARSERKRERAVAAATDEVARQLGNTRAVCRSSYVHPDVITGYMDGSFDRAWSRRKSLTGVRGLDADERFALSFLRGRAQRSETSMRAA